MVLVETLLFIQYNHVHEHMYSGNKNNVIMDGVEVLLLHA